MQLYKKARSNNGVAVGHLPGSGEGRVITKVEEKMKRYAKGVPNIFLMSQYSCLPFEERGIEAVKSYFEDYGSRAPACNYSGIFYFDRFRLLKWIKNVGSGEHRKLQRETISQFQKAFCRMCP